MSVAGCYINYRKTEKKDGNLDGDQIMATTLEIIRGIATSSCERIDGAHDEGSSYDGKLPSYGIAQRRRTP